MAPARVASLRVARPRTAWATAAVLVAVFAGLYLLFVCLPFGQSLDESAFGELPWLSRSARDQLDLARLWLIALAALIALALLIAAMVRRRWRSVLLAVLVAAVGIGLGAIARHLLPRPYLGDPGYVWNTFPSGHMAATMSLLAAAGLLRTGERPGRLADAGLITLGTAAGWVQIASFAHRQSDVVGAAVLVAAIVAVVAAVVGRELVVPLPVLRAVAGEAVVAAALLIVAYALTGPVMGYVAFVGTVLLVLASVTLVLGLRVGGAPSRIRAGRRYSSS